MIEIERKFDLQEGEREKLIEGAVFLGKKEFTDVYFDTPELTLSLKSYWLRMRGNKWELKVLVNKDNESEKKTDQYQELETEEEIAKELGLGAGNLKDLLESKGFVPLATIITTRESYSRGEFHIDFDSTNFEYATCEIELMVEDVSEIQNAEQKIVDFAKSLGLQSKMGRSKLAVYLEKFSPSVYLILREAGIIK